MKRFYTAVSTVAVDGGWIVRLDARELRTPGKAPFVFPTRAAADLVREEWDGVEGEISSDAMPVHRLAAAAIDVVAQHREGIARATAAYAETDLLCYRADEPRGLVERQANAWDPLIDWARSRYGAPLDVHAGVLPKPQPTASLEALAHVVAGLDDWRLSGLHAATQTAGSLIIALALMERRLDAEGAFAASQVDETWQIERWGEDPEATARRARLAADLRAVERFLTSLTE